MEHLVEVDDVLVLDAAGDVDLVGEEAHQSLIGADFGPVDLFDREMREVFGVLGPVDLAVGPGPDFFFEDVVVDLYW